MPLQSTHRSAHRAAAVLAIICCGGCAPLNRAPVDAAKERFVATLETQNGGGTATTVAAPGTSDGFSGESSVIAPVRHEQPIPGSGFQIHEVIHHARTHHPRAIAAGRMIDQARVQVESAGMVASPEFVLDLDTPVHDRQDPTELSTRVTFPIQQRSRTQNLVRRARADLARAQSIYQTTLRQLGQDALSAAIRLAYLQQRSTLDEQASQLAEERSVLLSPGLQQGDTARILMDHVGAIAAASQASRDAGATREELALARAELGQAMGIDASDRSDRMQTLSIEMSLDSESIPMPPMADVVAAVVRDSTEIDAADWAVQKGWIEHRLALETPLAMEIGPRYQDRLGRDEDTVGMRFQSDLPMLNDSRPAIASAEINARVLQDQRELSRHQIAAAVAKDYLQLEAVSRQLHDMASETFVIDQQAILDDPQTLSLLTGEQQIRIRQAIVRHQQDVLELQYRMTMLRSRLRLHAWFEPGRFVVPGGVHRSSMNHQINDLTGQ